MPRLSAVIITYNEEQHMARCIRSLQEVADEVLVLDSFSTDRTVDIAREMGALVYQEKFRGYIAQKNLAIQLASHHYILSLDADEALSRPLAEAILREKKTFPHRAYRMRRCTNYCGKFIRHGLWYPDKKVRLFDRSIAHWGGMNPHDRIELPKSITPKLLEGEILHFSFPRVEDLVWQNNRLSSIAAASLRAKGKKSSLFKMIVRPAWAFFRGYVLRRGFMDGLAGFSIAIHTAHQVFQKYSKLQALQRAEKAAATRTLEQEAALPRVGQR